MNAGYILREALLLGPGKENIDVGNNDGDEEVLEGVAIDKDLSDELALEVDGLEILRRDIPSAA